MFHHSRRTVPAPDWAMSTERGDIALFRFPVSEDGANLSEPKRRPCLVLDTFQSGHDRFVELAYGTSSRGRANRGYELIIRQSQSQAIAGLTKPTRFVCARRITVHINNAGFDCPGEEVSPVIGRLDEPLLERMYALRARIQAEANIAADYWEKNKRHKRSGGTKLAVSFREPLLRAYPHSKST